MTIMQHDQAQRVIPFSVLFVDDEKNILSSLRRLFRQEGYTIHLANSGVEGLEILRHHHIDLVVSDMRMPEMNGAQFLQQVAEQWPGTVRILLTGYSEISCTIDAINKGRIYQYISKPWEDNDIKLSVRQALRGKQIERERDHLLKVTRQQNEELEQLNNNLESMVAARTSEVEQTMSMLETAFDSIKSSYNATVKICSNLIEMREGTLQGHSSVIAEQARQLALTLGMSEQDAEQVYNAGLLRDIGKMGLPDSFIRKPYEDLDALAKEEFERHVFIGESILASIEPLQDAAKIIRHYRENFDGGGYPDRLIGEAIPLGARILSVVNDYDALQTTRLLSQLLTPQEAELYLREHEGTLYDPEVVRAYIKQLNHQRSVDHEDLEVRVASNRLKAGMRLSRDLRTSGGVMLLSSGYVLGEYMIHQLCSLEQNLNEAFQIYIQRRH
jgi:response regulator RpfG family c-di-GMP phosphodiesterase